MAWSKDMGFKTLHASTARVEFNKELEHSLLIGLSSRTEC